MTPNKKKVMLPNDGESRLGRADRPRRHRGGRLRPLHHDAGLAGRAQDTDGIALSLTPLKGPEIAVAPRLRVAARIGVGYDAVDIPALTARGIPLMVVGTANSVSVAEHAIFMMYALAKKVMFQDAAVRDNRWQDRWKDVPVDLAEKTILIVGFGRIGTRTAKRCLAMDMQVRSTIPMFRPRRSRRRAASRSPISTPPWRARTWSASIVRRRPRRSACSMRRASRRMKPSAYIINTARGGIIDECALQAALAGGKLAGAGIDVFDKEPTPADNPLFRLPTRSSRRTWRA